MKRKEKGQRELDEFLEKKEAEKEQRKRDNIEKEAKLREENKKLCEQSGWHKVAINVALKQGEHPGKKEIHRMREAIINKRNDELK